MPVKEGLQLANKVVGLFSKWFGETKGRRTRRALLAGQRYIKRTRKLFPEVKNDKYLTKYEKIFSQNSIRK